MNRRLFLQGVAGISAGLILPDPSIRRYWFLDQTMLRTTKTYTFNEYDLEGVIVQMWWGREPDILSAPIIYTRNDIDWSTLPEPASLFFIREG